MNNVENEDREVTRLRERLKQAIETQVVPANLEDQIWSRIQSTRRTPSWALAWAQPWAIAAGAVVAFLGLSVAYQLGHLRLTTNSQESYIGSVSNRVATIMRVGLGDHIHCSVFRKFPRNAPPWSNS